MKQCLLYEMLTETTIAQLIISSFIALSPSPCYTYEALIVILSICKWHIGYANINR